MLCTLRRIPEVHITEVSSPTTNKTQALFRAHQQSKNRFAAYRALYWFWEEIKLLWDMANAPTTQKNSFVHNLHHYLIKFSCARIVLQDIIPVHLSTKCSWGPLHWSFTCERCPRKVRTVSEQSGYGKDNLRQFRACLHDIHGQFCNEINGKVSLVGNGLGTPGMVLS